MSRLQLSYESLWSQLGLYGYGATEKARLMNNLVARFLYEHPLELRKWDEYDEAWKKWHNRTTDKVPTGFEDTGYYNVLKKACALYGYNYKTLEKE